LNSQLLIDITGWLGSVLILTAFALLNYHKVTANSKLYQILNILGSICLIINTVVYHAFPSAFINVVWLIIAMIALTNIYKARKAE
jgi:hypothetical protein